MGLCIKRVRHAKTRYLSSLVSHEPLLWCQGVQGFGARGCKGGLVEVKCFVHLTIRGQCRVQAGSLEEVEGDKGLGC